MKADAVITGLGVVSPIGIGKDDFFKALQEGRDGLKEARFLDEPDIKSSKAYTVDNFAPQEYLGPRGLRNLDRTTLLLLVASKLAMDDAGVEVSETNTDSIGVVTGTTLGSVWSITEFDREILTEGIDFANPALFPNTVINAPSSYVSIKFNIQGFNTTISTGFPSFLDALRYALDFLEMGRARVILVGCVESLSWQIFLGFYKLGYLAGIRGEEICCPFDRRRNGAILGEGAVTVVLEAKEQALSRKVKILGEILGCASYFDAFRLGKIHPQGEGIREAVKRAIQNSGLQTQDFDYISSCANSTQDLDRIEFSALKEIWGKSLKKIPVSSVKSCIGETFSASGGFQLASCLGGMEKGFLPPTLNYREKDPDIDIDCVPNKSQKKDIKHALISCSGPGGFNSACVLRRPCR